MSNQIRKVLVHGANGVQGGAIARRLREEGFEVRGSVRNPARSAALQAAGIEIAAADLESPSALRNASEGADAVVLTLPMDWTRETVLRWARHAAEAAREAAVGLLVLNGSGRLPEEETDVPGFELRRAAEAVLHEAGPPCIVLRPPFYLDNLGGPWIAGGMVRDRTLAYPLPEGLRTSWLATADLGAYVAAALRRPDLAGRAFDIGGPDALDGPALARELSPALGHQLRYYAVPPQTFEQGLAAQLGPAVARGIARSYHWIAGHATTALLSGASPELTRGLSRPPQAAADWARSRAWRET